MARQKRQPIDYVLDKDVVDDQKRRLDETDMELAEVCGVHPATFSRWLNGRYPCPLGAALALERHFGMPITEFTRPMTGSRTTEHPEQYRERIGERKAG